MKPIVTPCVSVALPVYNGQQYVAEVIESLLAQTFGDFELLIGDNASTDDTLQICRAFAARDTRIRVLTSARNRGAAWNFNRLFREARGRYFSWAAHDDLHEPEFLRRCVEVLDGDDSIVLSFPMTDFIDEHGRKLKDYAFPLDLNTVTRRQLFLFYVNGGHIVQEVFGVIRSSVLKRTPLIGPYVGSDLILLGYLALAGRFVQVPEVLFHHREHGGRSVIAAGGDRGFTNWFDSSNSGHFAMPRWRRLYESAKSVFASPMPLGNRLAHLVDILRSAHWNRRNLMNDVVTVVTQRATRG